MTALDAAQYRGLESITQLLLDHGARVRQQPAEPLQLAERDLPLLVGTVRLREPCRGGERSVLSQWFESFIVAESKEQLHGTVQSYTGSEVLRPFFNDVYNPSRVVRSGTMAVVVLHDSYFSGRENVFTVWDIQEDTSLRLRTILDHPVEESIGTVSLTQLVQLDEDRSFLVGESMGGDAGETWGSWWIGLWTQPRALRVLRPIRYSLGEEDERRHDWFTFETRIDLTTLRATVTQLRANIAEGEDGERRYEIIPGGETVHEIDLTELVSEGG